MNKKFFAAAALLATAPLGIVTAAPAQAASYGMLTTSSVNLRSGPGTGYAVVGSIPSGGTVDIRCYVYGETLTDAWGNTNNIWERTASGSYVWDGLVNTGSNNPVVPTCTTQPTSGAQAAQNAYNTFKSRYLWQAVDVDGYYGAQCWDLAARFSLDNGMGRIQTGNGAAYGIYTLYDTNGNATYYDRIANTPDAVPRAGDIIVWGTGVGSYGHVAIVESANLNTFTSIEQNWNGQMYAQTVTHNYSNVLGWLRPKQWR